MISRFIEEKLHQAAYKKLEDGTYFGEIPGLKGLWSDGETLEACRDDLREALESWLVVSLRHGDAIPGLETERAAQGDAAYA